MQFNLQKEVLNIDTLVLDLNGTLTTNGKLLKGTKEKINKLKKLDYNIILFTGNQRKNGNEICSLLGIKCIIAETSKDKEKEMKKLNIKTCASIGNARIDIPTFKYSRLAIATLQSEGIHKDIIKYVDIIVPSINDALDLFINKDSLIATLKE
ncbi:HAD hydrolase family protein [Candidatus Woesearchaeota archaeon]|nr:HAD hydrolase family protein [Candidatus Woesearchaeota archaeon]